MLLGMASEPFRVIGEIVSIGQHGIGRELAFDGAELGKILKTVAH